MRKKLENYSSTPDNDWYKQRLNLTFYIIITVFLVTAARLFYLQMIKGEEYKRLSENNCIRLQSIDPSRGMIFDKNGNLLVDNRPSYDLAVIPKNTKNRTDTVKKLSKYVDAPEEDFFQKLEKTKGLASFKPVLLKQDIGRDALASIEVRKFDLPGVEVNVTPRRNYIYKNSASHLIGYLSEINTNELKLPKYKFYRPSDFVGKFGVEKAYEDYLRGVRGGRQVEVNVTGQVVKVLDTVDAKPGNNIYLTIDHRLQKKAEELLEGVAGAAAAMDPKTGDILAMASSPSFNQNTFVSGMTSEEWRSLINNPLRPMENKAIQAEYPPASTYKIITAIAALEEGIIDENTTIFCPGYYRYGNRVFRCWKKGGHGSVNVISALAGSCDCFFYQLGQKLGVDRLAWYAKAAGLGKKTGIFLDHEAGGLIPTAGWKKNRFGVPWHKGENLSIAIGQGYNLVTPLQMLGLTAAVANGGFRMKPNIVKKVMTAEGKEIMTNTTEVVGKLPVSNHVLDIIRRGLWSVVNSQLGTAKIAKLGDIVICGKTGTAQVVGRKKSEAVRERDKAPHLKAHAWFVAYAPEKDPEIATVVFVEHGEHGSSAAAPVARELIRSYLSRPEKEKKLNFVKLSESKRKDSVDELSEDITRLE